jgi:hypothetical protein
MKYREPLFRPPAEADSLIIQAAYGCPHNTCDSVLNRIRILIRILIPNRNRYRNRPYSYSLSYSHSLS